MTFPVPQPYKITQGYKATHKANDIAPVPGGQTDKPCLAPEAGVIVTSNFKAALEGNYIIMRGDSGKYYYFGHFANRLVGAGARVSEGEQIGILGKTGAATGIHLHFEVRTTPTGGQINPSTINWTTSPQGGNVDVKTKAKQIGDIYKAMTGADISQKDLDFYVGRPDGVTEMIYALFPATQKARDVIKLLENDRDRMYGIMEKDKAEIADLQRQLKEALNGNAPPAGTKLEKGNYYVE